MGIAMKRFGLSVAAVVALTGSAFAADMPVKAVKAPPPVVVTPWDIAFGSALMNDYIFRGVTQSNHKPSVAGYFEGRYNVNDTLQLYLGAAGESISFANRAAAEIDIYGGIRPTFGAFAFDFGVWGYLYPGGTCYYGAPVDTAGRVLSNECATNFLLNGNVIKKDVSFYEVFGKVTYTINDMWAIGLNEYYSPNFLNTGAYGNYASGTVKFTAPGSFFGTSGIGMYASGEFGRQWLGRSDSFYGTAIPSPLGGGPFPFGIPYKSYNTWNAGLGFTYKALTLDLRYSSTDLNRGDCNAFTSDHTASAARPSFTPINPTGVASTWCGDAYVAKFSVDTTLNALK